MSAGVAETPFAHAPVLWREVIAHLPAKRDFVFADLTVGGGGHALAILQARADARLYVGIDRDRVALQAARETLAPFGARVRLVQARFSELQRVLGELALTRVDGLLADLGVSSPQLDRAERGFSFMREGPLDMRMGEGPTLKELLHTLDEAALADILFRFGEERHSRRVARAIVAARATLETTTQLADVVRRALPKGEQRIDPATRTFQALRIAVNDELAELDRLLAMVPEVLADGGVAMIISFHSLEDRAVKEAFRDGARGCVCPPKLPECRCGRVATLEVVTRKPIVAGDDEIAINARARSAKLRVARRVPRAA